MISLKNKPTTLFIAALILGIGMLTGVGYVVYTLVGSFFVFKYAGLGIIIGVPAILLYIGQIIFYIVLGYLLLRSIYKWSVPAIIASTIISPLILVVIIASIASQSDHIVDFSSPVGVGLLIFFLLTPLAMGVVAYNDIRYRLPKIN
ncbi:MAG: hypothetical protein JWP06_611 [Candidatus Saccharibacteria bacterium]|nr:hypothetical protein [Candidatus Saccharibacteria bacterium]